jgi:group I intron endonuclease
MEKYTSIYALKDPACLGGRIRYVGKADNVALRYLDHLRTVRRGEKSHKANWIRSLAAQGFQPDFETLEDVPFSEWQAIEREYIRVFRAIGILLTNLMGGGDGGMDGRTHSVETRAKISNSQKGKKISSEARAKMSAARVGRKLSLEHRANIGAANKGHIHSLETREKIRASNNGRKRSPETCEKIKVVALARWAIKRANGEKLII